MKSTGAHFKLMKNTTFSLTIILLLLVSCAGAGKIKKEKSNGKDKITRPDLSGRHLTELPNLRDSSIEILDMSNNMISILDSSAISKLPSSLKVLNIIGNRLQELIYVLKEDLPNLTSLGLSHNKLSSIRIGSQLSSLNLSRNRINYINLNVRNLDSLDISYNPELSNLLLFDIDMIKSIKREAILNDEPFQNGLKIKLH